MAGILSFPSDKDKAKYDEDVRVANELEENLSFMGPGDMWLLSALLEVRPRHIPLCFAHALN